MSSWEVIFHRLASREYLKAMEKYRRVSTRVYERFLRAMDHAIQNIEVDPYQWPEIRRGYRWVLLHKFPYILFFPIRTEDRVRILAFAPTKRRPGYWLRRANYS